MYMLFCKDAYIFAVFYSIFDYLLTYSSPLF